MKSSPIAEIRAFNRFYTGILGLLNRHMHASRYTLVEARILYELHHQHQLTATELTNRLQLDKGYLSRILRKLLQAGLLNRTTSQADRRLQPLRLTPLGESEFSKLNSASDRQVQQLTQPLTTTELQELVQAMARIRNLWSHDG